MSFSHYDEDGARTSHRTHCCIGARRATHCAMGDDSRNNRRGGKAFNDGTSYRLIPVHEEAPGRCGGHLGKKTREICAN